MCILMHWKPIEGSNGSYEINETGQVRSKQYQRDWFILKPLLAKMGYYMYSINYLGKNQKVYLHRLIAKAFIPNPECLEEVNHKNGVKTDNRLENLEWCTHKYNMRHAFISGLTKSKGAHKTAKLSNDQVKEALRLMTKEGWGQTETARQFGVSQSLMWKISKGYRTSIDCYYYLHGF